MFGTLRHEVYSKVSTVSGRNYSRVLVRLVGGGGSSYCDGTFIIRYRTIYLHQLVVDCQMNYKRPSDPALGRYLLHELWCTRQRRLPRFIDCSMCYAVLCGWCLGLQVQGDIVVYCEISIY